jgi:hypothetical protein
MLVRRTFSGFLLLVILFQAISLGSGLLGACAENATMICHCNHGSSKEKHASKEDTLFKSSKTTRKNAHLLAHTSEKLEKNCHSSKSGEAHLCSCKKKKSSLAKLSIYHQVWLNANLNSLLVISHNSEFQCLALAAMRSDGWNWKLIKPPRVIPS